MSTKFDYLCRDFAVAAISFKTVISLQRAVDQSVVKVAVRARASEAPVATGRRPTVSDSPVAAHLIAVEIGGLMPFGLLRPVPSRACAPWLQRRLRSHAPPRKAGAIATA